MSDAFAPEWFRHSLAAEAQTGTIEAGGCDIAIRRWGDDVGHRMYELLGRTYHRVMLDQPLALTSAVRSLLADWRHSHAIQVPLNPRR